MSNYKIISQFQKRLIVLAFVGKKGNDSPKSDAWYNDGPCKF